jgi:hypothetical protein
LPKLKNLLLPIAIAMLRALYKFVIFSAKAAYNLNKIVLQKYLLWMPTVKIKFDLIIKQTSPVWQ